MFMYIFNHIMLIIVMVMSCDIISDIMCMFYFLCEIIVIIKINQFIYFSYIVSIISVNDTVFINSSTISKIITCLIYIMRY